MTTILALETSTAHGSVALWCKGAVVQEWHFVSDRTHNSLLFAPLAAALDMADPDMIVVGTGPGSYSGVRVALSAALGVALAKKAALIGWPSLTAFDMTAEGCVIGNARRGSFFIADIAAARLQGEPRLVDEETLARDTQGRTVWTFDDTAWVPGAILVKPSAAWLARRAAALPPEEIVALSAATPEPIYLRAPFITTPKSRVPQAAAR